MWEIAQALKGQADDTFAYLDFNQGDTLLADTEEAADSARYRLEEASDFLDDLIRLSGQLLEREQNKQEQSQQEETEH